MDESTLCDLLPMYYTRLFPYTDYYRWLSYGEVNTFARREFSFTLRDDIYLRFKAFRDLDELKAEMKRLQPHKIDIGAIYNVSPAHQKREIKFEPIQRELVFDIDMTDYDDVRTCCSGADVCCKCWKYMALACKILDAALREDFGFEHILWVFSGRRGIHCWVCDRSARFLTQNGRRAIANYLQLITGGEFQKKKVKIVKKMHYSIKRAITIIEPFFIEMSVKEQNMLGTDEGVNKFLGMITEDDLREEVKAVMDQHSGSLQRWEAFTKYYIGQKQSSQRTKWRWMPYLIEEIMIQYVYPRLDINVTKGMNHLLKTPFSIHPKTGKVSIPLNPKIVDQFDPETVPTLSMLIDEINVFDEKEKGNQGENAKRIKDYKKTSLNKPLYIFQEFIRGLENSQKEDKLKKMDSKMEF